MPQKSLKKLRTSENSGKRRKNQKEKTKMNCEKRGKMKKCFFFIVWADKVPKKI